MMNLTLPQMIQNRIWVLVIAAAVDSDILAFAARIEDPEVHIFSEGYGRIDVDLRDLSPKKKEEGTERAFFFRVDKEKKT